MWVLPSSGSLDIATEGERVVSYACLLPLLLVSSATLSLLLLHSFTSIQTQHQPSSVD